MSGEKYITHVKVPYGFTLIGKYAFFGVHHLQILQFQIVLLKCSLFRNFLK